MTVEEWRPVKGYEGLYEVSNLGKVRSIPRPKTKGGIMKLYRNPHNGYVYVSIGKGEKRNGQRVHVLVANAFLGADIHGYSAEKSVDHIDGNKTNNCVENLQVISIAENLKKAHASGAIKYAGFKTICLDDMKTYKTYTDAARAYGGSRGEMVRRVCDGERSHYRGKHFCRLSDYENKNIPEYTGKTKKKASESLWR